MGWGGRRRRHQLRKRKPSLPAPSAKGKGKEKKERKERGRGWGGEEITKEQGKENISESSNQEKNRDGFLFLPTTKCTETIGHKRVKLPNPSHIRCTNTGQGGGPAHSGLVDGGGFQGMLRSRPEMHLSWDSPGTLPCPAELPTRSCPPSPHPTAKRTRANWRSGRASFLTPLASGHGEDGRELGLFGCRASPRCPLSRRRCIWGPFPPSQGWLLSFWGWVEVHGTRPAGSRKYAAPVGG